MESFIRTSNANIHYQVLGDLSQSPQVIVLLHEALGSIGQWKSFPGELHKRSGLPVIIPERSGHGKSSPLVRQRDSHYLHEYAQETKSFLEELLNGQRIILVGHSDGGTIALLLAKHFSAQIDGLVTMAAHTFVEAETLAGIIPAVDAWKAGKLTGLKKYHGEKTEALFFAWAKTWRADFFRSWDIRQEICWITVPVLAIQGDSDQYGTEAQVESIQQAAVTCEVQILSDCGHHPHIEKPETVLNRIERWLNTLKP